MLYLASMDILSTFSPFIINFLTPLSSLHSTPLLHLPTNQNPIQNNGIPLYFLQILTFFIKKLSTNSAMNSTYFPYVFTM